jgi:hypothetical protein
MWETTDMTRNTKLLGLALSAAGLLVGTDASAALLTIGGGTGIVTPASNDVLGSGIALQDNATLSVTGPAVLSFYFVGSESGYVNTLNVTGGGSHTELNTIPGFAGPTPLFQITVNSAGTVAVPMNFTNNQAGWGTLTPGGGTPAKSIAFAYLNCLTGPSCAQTTTATNMVLFSLDDDGAGPDDNHDDYVGYVVATAVPLPAAFWLLGSALLGLFGIGRRRAVA